MIAAGSLGLLYGSSAKGFVISMRGDVDDDLIVLRCTPKDSTVEALFQMHNPSSRFYYNGRLYPSTHIPGAIDFSREYRFTEGSELFIVMTANEREEAHLSERIRTHYKSERLTVSGKTLLPPLMPERDSVPGYPRWYAEGEEPRMPRTADNGEIYNYYHLFDNSVVQTGLIFPRSGRARIGLHGSDGTIRYTYTLNVTPDPKRLRSEQELGGLHSSHPFAEVGNILNDKEGAEAPNEDYVSSISVEYEGRSYHIPSPYPIMYPNQIYGVANE